MVSIENFEPKVEYFDPFKEPFSGNSIDEVSVSKGVHAWVCSACSACSACGCAACTACTACGGGK